MQMTLLAGIFAPISGFSATVRFQARSLYGNNWIDSSHKATY